MNTLDLNNNIERREGEIRKKFKYFCFFFWIENTEIFPVSSRQPYVFVFPNNDIGGKLLSWCEEGHLIRQKEFFWSVFHLSPSTVRNRVVSIFRQLTCENSWLSIYTYGQLPPCAFPVITDRTSSPGECVLLKITPALTDFLSFSPKVFVKEGGVCK